MLPRRTVLMLIDRCLSVAYLAPLAGVLWFGAAYLFFLHELRYYQSAGH